MFYKILCNIQNVIPYYVNGKCYYKHYFLSMIKPGNQKLK